MITINTEFNQNVQHNANTKCIIKKGDDKKLTIPSKTNQKVESKLI